MSGDPRCRGLGIPTHYRTSTAIRLSTKQASIVTVANMIPERMVNEVCKEQRSQSPGYEGTTSSLTLRRYHALEQFWIATFSHSEKIFSWPG